MKAIGIGVLALGIALAAAAGARLSPAVEEQVTRAGAAKLRSEEPEPSAAIAPEARLAEWASRSGLLFGVGLALIIVGAAIGRRAVRLEALEEPAARAGEAEARAPLDLGVAVSTLARDVASLAEDLKRVGSPTSTDYERFKSEIHRLELEGFEPIVDARGRVQARYGLVGFAELFGPISSAERRLARAWSALVDQHWIEARDSAARAAGDLAQAEKIVQGLVETGRGAKA